jgi:hypothetical protein
MSVKPLSPDDIKGCELLNKNLEKSGETSRKNQNETTILERNDHVEPKNR